jgi:predicted enzyme related to lactoylglutathione lyase
METTFQIGKCQWCWLAPVSVVDRYAQGTPSYVELTSPDPQAAKRFYGSLFDWELEGVAMGEAGVYVAASVHGDRVAGIAPQRPPLSGQPAFWGVYLAVDDVDATTAKVAAAGGAVEAGPFDVMALGRMSSIQDPTGVQVNLWQAGQSIGTARVNEPGCPIWHELTSPDLPAATAFYRDVLGVAWESMPMETGDDYTCLVVDGRAVAGASPPQMQGLPPRWDVYVNVEDCDATLARAVGLGAEPLVPAYDLAGIGRTAMLRDPQGALMGLLQDPPHA